MNPLLWQVLAMVLAEEPSQLSWQGFILLNLVGIIGLSFWLGSLSRTVTRLDEDRKAIDQAIDQVQADLQRMRSAYHHVSGFLTKRDPDWRPMDVDKR